MPNSPSVPAESSDAGSKNGMDDLRPAIELALQESCRFDHGCPVRLADAIRYALLAPGKRLRPALVLMAAEACGGTAEEAMPAAVAVEMIHSYSLIHDDLPAMDDDDLRRGRPTVHIEFDEATAILAGDALLAQAFSHLAERVSNPEKSAAAIAVLARAAGPTQLVGGQADDLAAETVASEQKTPDSRIAGNQSGADLDRDLKHLESIHRRKTGALFAASLEMGAILVGASHEKRQVLSDYARDIGLAFQVVDDLLDFTADSSEMGKRTGKDADRGKLTYPGLLGIAGAKEKAEQLVEAARRHIAVFDAAGWRLMWLANYVLERTH